jgi:hypothetical protein
MGSPLTPFAAQNVDSAIVSPGVDGHNARPVTNSRGAQLFCFTTASNWRRNTAQEADQSKFCVYAPATPVPVLPPHLCSALASTSAHLSRVLAAWLLCYLDLCSLDSEDELFVKVSLRVGADLGPLIERRRS